MAGDRQVYVHWSTVLKEANKITACSYLYDDIENSALQNIHVPDSRAITKPSEINGFLCGRDAILL